MLLAPVPLFRVSNGGVTLLASVPLTVKVLPPEPPLTVSTFTPLPPEVVGAVKLIVAGDSPVTLVPVIVTVRAVGVLRVVDRQGRRAAGVGDVHRGAEQPPGPERELA